MNKRQARFEIVCTGAEQRWHARFRSSNGAIIWSTENYRDRRSAERAVECVAAAFGGGDAWIDMSLATDTACVFTGSTSAIEVRDVNEIPVAPTDLDDAKALGQWAAAQPKVKAEIKADKKIHAIKELRGLTGASLLQAKLAVEQIPRWKR